MLQLLRFAISLEHEGRIRVTCTGMRANQKAAGIMHVV